VPHRIIRSWYTGRWWVGCYIWYYEEGPERAAACSVLKLTEGHSNLHRWVERVYKFTVTMYLSCTVYILRQINLGSVVVQGHWKWHHRYNGIRVPHSFSIVTHATSYEIKRDIGRKSRFFIPLLNKAPLRGELLRIFSRCFSHNRARSMACQVV